MKIFSFFPKRRKIAKIMWIAYFCYARHERSPRRPERICPRRRPSLCKNEKTPLETPAPGARERKIVIHHPLRTTNDLFESRPRPQRNAKNGAKTVHGCGPYGLSEGALQPPIAGGRGLLIANTDILLPHSIGQISSRGTRLFEDLPDEISLYFEGHKIHISTRRAGLI